jgi:hypothetical protein
VLGQLVDKLTDAAANRVEQRFFTTVGKHVVTKILWIVGLCAVVATAWLAGTGKISP